MDIEKFEIPKSLDKACENLTDKPTKEAGTTFADIWFLVFGGISEKAEMKRLKIAANISKYEKELKTATDAIPEMNRIEPKLQIVGPALQKSQYCMEEESIRDMFVKLISRSMDSAYETKIRPSFSEIISQMSPLDAENLKIFSFLDPITPVCEYRLNRVKFGYKTVKTNVFLENSRVQNIDLQASSLSEISRLGLIKIDYDKYYTNENAYDMFEQHPAFLHLKNYISPVPEGGYQSPRDDYLFKDVELLKGIAELTPLGKDFLDVCLAK
ncbi:DUF4393 domain-containing protein [Scatolibacter rhodanostii]|uniref:DUF4393 domain-containing protein n=1 Tax=Scatolibacter rhodanostii TaxID=2014781 RepID=UPI000C074118|nr:DUF4393 domain-containing protein [Scatolibacter rhodanostii]